MEQTAAAGGGMMGTVLWLVVMIALFYFMLIRPQKKQEKQKKAMLEALKVGDSITTISGIVGKVLKIKDDKVCIEIGDRTHKHPMTIKREAVATVVPCTKEKRAKDDIEILEEADEVPQTSATEETAE